MRIIEREVGQFPISIGTSLALEGLLGIHPNQPKNVLDNKSITTIFINIRTLVRNLFSAIETKRQAESEPIDALLVLRQEMETISVVLQQAGLKAKVQYYITGSDVIKWVIPKAKFKEPKTPKQIITDIFEKTVAIDVLPLLRDAGIDYLELNKAPERTLGTTVILTHHCFELLWKSQFDRLLLLESNTGRIKPYNLWYTKLNGIKDTAIPFTSFTLLVFGDNIQVESQPKRIRDQLRLLMEERKWTPVTSRDKIYHDLSKHALPELKALFVDTR